MIVLEGLTKRFGDRTAIENVSLHASGGEIVALLGPNGAGKTTTTRLLLGLLTPSRGRALVGGLDASQDSMEIRAQTGFVTENPGFYSRVTGRRNLEFFGTLYGLNPRVLGERIESNLRRFELWDRRDDPFGTYSRGMKQKLALARSLLHDPQLLLLDEPTAGLSPEARVDFRNLLVGLREDGKTILLCTHDLDEASRLATRIAILKTRLLAFDTPSRLRGQGERPRIRVCFTGSIPDQLEAGLRDLPGIHEVRPSPEGWELVVENPHRDAPEIVKRCVEDGARVREVQEVEPKSLEQIYLELVR